MERCFQDWKSFTCNVYSIVMALFQAHRPNLAATAEAKDLMASTAEEARGARSYPTAKSALIWNIAITIDVQNMKLVTEGKR